MLHYTTVHILASTSILFKWHLVTNLFIIFQTFSMVFMSHQLPSLSRTGFPLQSWNGLVLLELRHGAISCIVIYPFCGNTMHSHNISISWIMSLWYFPLSMSIHFSLNRQASAANGSTDLHTYWPFYSSLNSLSTILLILFAPHTTMASIVMTVKYKLM